MKRYRKSLDNTGSRGKEMVAAGSPPSPSGTEHLPTLAWDGPCPCRGDSSHSQLHRDSDKGQTDIAAQGGCGPVLCLQCFTSHFERRPDSVFGKFISERGEAEQKARESGSPPSCSNSCWVPRWQEEVPLPPPGAPPGAQTLRYRKRPEKSCCL